MGVFKKYKDLIKVSKDLKPLDLGEGNTPLISLDGIVEKMGGGFKLYAKYEGLNPTGSFKDRGMVVAVSDAVHKGFKATICASTGNTASSAAAYSSRAGIKSYVIVPSGNVSRGKLAAITAYGGKLIQINGNFDDAQRLVKEIVKVLPIMPVNSFNEARWEGQKTSAFEIVDELGEAPDILSIPVGNACNICTYHYGFKEYAELKGTKIPMLIGNQAEGAAPLVHGKIVENPETVASAIRIGNPVRGERALEVIKETNGKILAVSDSEILEAQKMLALEGVFVEPASAASLAGLIKEQKNGFDLKDKTVVLVCTGNGLKDIDVIDTSDAVTIDSDISELKNLLEKDLDKK